MFKLPGSIDLVRFARIDRSPFMNIYLQGQVKGVTFGRSDQAFVGLTAPLTAQRCYTVR